MTMQFLRGKSSGARAARDSPDVGAFKQHPPAAVIPKATGHGPCLPGGLLDFGLRPNPRPEKIFNSTDFG